MRVSMPMNMKKTTIKGKIEKFNILAPELLESLRTVRVYLPPHYEQNHHQRYPVLYMHDGQNLFFNKDTHFKVGAWKVHRALDNMSATNVIDGFIVVGLDSSKTYRSLELSLLNVKKEYTAKSTSSLPPQGHLYAEFMSQTLKTYIDTHYRTKPDLTYIGGSSMGGIASLIMVLKNPHLYKGALVFTPAGMIHYQKDMKRLFKEQIMLMKKQDISFPKLYFMVGGIGLETIIKPFCDFAVPYLIRLGYKEGENINYLYQEKAPHNEKAWASIFPNAFKWMID